MFVFIVCEGIGKGLWTLSALLLIQPVYNIKSNVAIIKINVKLKAQRLMNRSRIYAGIGFPSKQLQGLTMSQQDPANWSHVFARLRCLLKWWWAYNSGKVIMFTLCETWRWVTWGWSDNTEAELSMFRLSSFSLPFGDLEFLEKQHSQSAIKIALRWIWRLDLETLCWRRILACRQQ